MILENRPFSEITENELLVLIQTGEMEGKRIDYKLKLPDDSDKAKRGFLADICSFANAGGGFIVYGMKEEAGKAVELPGFSCIDVDKEILRLESIIQSGISPRIPGIHLRAIQLTNGNYSLIIRTPVSWASPHMISYDKMSKFYTRSSAGNYQMDVQEIRDAFLASDTLSTKINDFRLNRVGKIIGEETPVPINGKAKIILHLMPFNAFYDQSNIDLEYVAEKHQNLVPLYFPAYGDGVNIDGFYTFSQLRDDRYVSYTQIFRNGIIEAVHDELLDIRNNSEAVLPSIAIEGILLSATEKLLQFQKQLGIEVPILIYLTFVGVKGYTLAVSSKLQEKFYNRVPSHPIDRDTLLIPGIQVDKFDDIDLKKIMKPIFDVMWNASGWLRCMDYDKDGNWIGG